MIAQPRAWRRAAWTTRIAAAVWLGAVAACGRGPKPLTAADIAAIQRAALTTVFIEREGAKQLVLLVQAGLDEPTLAGRDGPRPELSALPIVTPDTTALALGIPVTILTQADVEAHFKAHADAWAAWYERYPGAPGLVTITNVHVEAQSPNAAWIIISRSCGEHCRAAWRVTVERGAKSGWHTVNAIALAMPKS